MTFRPIESSGEVRDEPEGSRGGPSDADVVARILGGDREAYRILVRRHQDRLYRYALHVTGDADAAADLTQASLVKAFTHLRRCRDPERFGAWLFRILVNRCKDHVKVGRKRRVDPDGFAAARLRSSSNPGRDLERSELRRQLLSVLSRLAPAQREAFVLRFVEGLSYEEIAERLGGSIPALKMRVHRARESIRAMLQEVV